MALKLARDIGDTKSLSYYRKMVRQVPASILFRARGNEDKDDYSVLFLPWHLYMDYGWLPNRGKRLRNPAQVFFNKPAISGDNIETGGIYSQSTNPISKYVEVLLGHRQNITNLDELLAPLNVKYIILANKADDESYDFLYRQEDLRVELKKPRITLFTNEYPTANVYGVDSVVYIKSLEDYLEKGNLYKVNSFSSYHPDTHI